MLVIINDFGKKTEAVDKKWVVCEKSDLDYHSIYFSLDFADETSLIIMQKLAEVDFSLHLSISDVQ
jgi:hypothetical protein